jgi:hypothetical protein
MKLNDISDESEYNIDNRTYYSQNYSITVMAYIMPKDSFIVEEIPNMIFAGFEGEKRKGSYAEIEELPCHMKDNTNKPTFEFQPINLKVHFSKCSNSYKFVMDIPFQIETINMENIRDIKIYLNDTEVKLDEGFKIEIGDELKFKNLIRFKTFEDSEIIIDGINYKNPISL